jgi:GAF domain-containing protein
MAESTEALSASLDALTTFVIGEQTMGETLRRIVELGQAAIPKADLTGLTLLTEQGRPTTAVFTGPATPDLDRVQYDTGQGPCLAAFRELRVINVPEMRTETRWPKVAAQAHDDGVRSSLSAPLILHDRGIGALNFYSRSDHAFTEHDEDTAQSFGLHAAVVVANAEAYWSAHTLSEQLQRAMSSRAEIEQAKGILMGQSGVTPEEAFDLLKRASQRENRKLREIAIEIVRRSQERRH